MIYEIKFDIKEYGSLKLYTSFEKLKNSLNNVKSSIKHTIPITEVKCSEIDKNNINYYDSIIINESDTKSMYYDEKYNVSILFSKEEEIRFPDIVYIALAMFSKILARNNKYLLHSSALVDSNSNGFVLVGDANAGKTSLGYELMVRHNCKLISNDHSIIGIEDGKPKILGGTKEIQMRLGAVELYFPELYNKINIISEDKWNKKIIVNEFIDQNLIFDNNDNIVLKNVFSINTSNSNEFFIRKKQEVDQFLFLYESMSRIIKGTYNYITGFDYAMPSMEDEQTLQNLGNLCKLILEQCNVYETKGSLKELAKSLEKKNGK